MFSLQQLELYTSFKKKIHAHNAARLILNALLNCTVAWNTNKHINHSGKDTEMLICKIIYIKKNPEYLQEISQIFNHGKE